MKTKFLFVGNYKGGVGKTTTTLNFALYASKMGKRVLAVDLDPQGSLSEILIENSNNFTDLNEGIIKEKSLNWAYDLYINKIQRFKSVYIDLSDKIIFNYKDKFHFIASTPFYQYGLDDLVEKMDDNIEYLSILKTIIDGILKKSDAEYDYIVFDCPPTNNIITKSAFLMSDFYIIPTILDKISINGVAHYVRTVEHVYNSYCNDSLSKYYFGDEPKLLGVFFNLIRGQVNYETEVSNYKQKLEGLTNKNIETFNTLVNNYVDINRSSAIGEVCRYRDDFEELVKKIVERINNYV